MVQVQTERISLVLDTIAPADLASRYVLARRKCAVSIAATVPVLAKRTTPSNVLPMKVILCPANSGELEYLHDTP
jgi:hypothetical protein